MTGALRPDDVLVVTQKVVSKAEGAIVDLATDRAASRGGRVRRALGPRPPPGRGRPARGGAGSSGWPTGVHHHRDRPRVRLRQRRGRRLERGPGERLRRDAAARRSRRVRPPGSGRPSGSGLGVDLAVIVSDCFGRPWRWGIVDVAIGVSGLAAPRRPAGPARRRRPDHALHRPGGGRRDRLGRRAGPRQDRADDRPPSSAARPPRRLRARSRETLMPEANSTSSASRGAAAVHRAARLGPSMAGRPRPSALGTSGVLSA